MIRSGRRQRPFQGLRSFPGFGRCFGAATDALQHDVEEQKLTKPETEGADARDHVEVGKLQRVVGNATRHARQSQEVLNEEREVEEEHRQPEVPLAQRLVIHVAGPLRQPVVNAAEYREQRARHQHVVEVRNHVVGVLHLDVDRGYRADETSEAANGEQENEADGEQHGRLEGHRTPPHRRDPVEHLHARRHRDQHGRVHEEQLAGDRHAGGEHVVRPDDERQDRDGRGGVHHRRVAEQRLARERGDDLRHDAERRQDHDVDLGVAEEPEDVLEHHRIAAAGRVEEVGAEVAVGQQHGHRAGQHRHHQRSAGRR